MFAFPYGSSGLSSGSTLVDFFSPQSAYGGYYDFHSSQQAQLQRARQQQLHQQRQQQAKEAQLRELARRQEMREEYENALRAERARRLAQSRSSYQPFYVHENNEEEEEKVQVRLPNGLRYIVPASWVERLHIKYGKHAHQLQPLPQRQKSPLPPEDVDVLNGVQEEDGHVRLDVPAQKHATRFSMPLSTSETATFAQAPTTVAAPQPAVDEEAKDVERLLDQQAPQPQSLPQRERSSSPPEDVDVLSSAQEEDRHVRPDYPAQKDATTFRVPLSALEIATPTQAFAPAPTTVAAPRPAVDEEAKDVERRLVQLATLSSRLSSLRSTYDPLPPASALVFSAPGKLAYNNSSNKPFQEYEQALERLLPKIDGVEVRGYEEVRTKRKALVGGIEKELEKLDRYRQEAWEQQQRQEEMTVMAEEKDSSQMDIDVTKALPEYATTPDPVSQEAAAATTVSEEAETSSTSAIMDTATEDGDVDIDEAAWDLVDDHESEGRGGKEV